MGYIGNTPAEKYQTLDKQTFSVSATTGYTLSSAVTNPQEIALFINNVRQNPNSSYTVSGTTLTLSSATSSGDVMYAVFLGKSVGTVGVPVGGVGTSQIIDANITTAKLASGLSLTGGLTVTGNLVTTDDVQIGGTATGNAIIKDKVGDQTAGNPQYTFTGNVGTGMRRATGDTLAFDTGGVERLKINNSGVTAAVKFVAGIFVGNGSGKGVEIGQVGGNRGEIAIETALTSAVGNMYFINGNGSVGSIVTNGSATAYNTSSDYRLKENVDYTFDATTRLKQLKPARFNFIADADKTVDGFIAHEVSSVVPEAVTGEKDATEMQGIDQSKLVPLLVKTIQELEARITELENA